MGAEGGEGSLEDGKLGGEFRLVGAPEGSAMSGPGLGILSASVKSGEADTAPHFGDLFVDGIVEIGRAHV